MDASRRDGAKKPVDEWNGTHKERGGRLGSRLQLSGVGGVAGMRTWKGGLVDNLINRRALAQAPRRDHSGI